jgi:integrase
MLDVCGPRERALFAVLAYAGLRLGEALALRVRDVDFGAGAIRVERSLSARGIIEGPKGSSARRAVPMVGILQEELKAYIPLGSGPDDLLFCTSSGRPLDHSNALRCFHRALEAAGLKG